MGRMKILIISNTVKILTLAMIIHEMQDLMMRKSWHTPENHKYKKESNCSCFSRQNRACIWLISTSPHTR